MYDICIIGGGASGMTAAIAAHQKNDGAAICIIEKNEILGRKILATGNGRCNLSNEGCENKDDTLDFLKRLGIYTRTDEEGRIYPYSEQASQVRAILSDHARTACSRIILGQSVSSVEKKDDVFVVKTEGGETVEAQQLIIASGGKAAPQHGTTGDGYAFAKALGHTVTKLGPALTGVETEDDLSPLKGVRAKCEAYLFEGMDNIWREPGEVQFTEDGLSGICIFNMVSMIRLRPGETYREAMHRYEIGIDLLPDFDEEEFIALLKQREQMEDIKKESRRLLTTFVNDKIADFIIEKSGTEAHELAAALKYSRFKVRSVKGWKDAQCTVGGVPYDEVDSETMKSLKTEGLYFAGEIMDYDGPCGGFNLQHAWETGIKAGKAAAADITRADD
ncbi:MAG: aminoacetone oxidase family FAD-binding enzyme [Firmicutes bacterium]|nr:aminoacetone oxidase family FAD-binding enzyme [Bacillota bacterium]